MRKWVSNGCSQPTLKYATPEHKAEFMDRFGKDGGFDAPNRWYKSVGFGVQNQGEKSLPEEARIVKVPALFWGGEQDFVRRPALLQPSIDADFLPQITSIVKDGGHWAHLERPEVFGEDLLGWLEDKFAWTFLA